MSRTSLEAVEAAARSLVAEGRNPSVDNVLAITGGSKSTVASFMREVRTRCGSRQSRNAVGAAFTMLHHPARARHRAVPQSAGASAGLVGMDLSQPAEARTAAAIAGRIDTGRTDASGGLIVTQRLLVGERTLVRGILAAPVGEHLVEAGIASEHLPLLRAEVAPDGCLAAMLCD